MLLAFPTNSAFELQVWSYDPRQQIKSVIYFMQQGEDKQQTEGHGDSNSNAQKT